jgi:hypothetical protein
MTMQPVKSLVAAAAAILLAASRHGAPSFVNGLVIDGAALDAPGGTRADDRWLGFFLDIGTRGTSWSAPRARGKSRS